MAGLTVGALKQIFTDFDLGNPHVVCLEVRVVGVSAVDSHPQTVKSRRADFIIMFIKQKGLTTTHIA